MSIDRNKQWTEEECKELFFAICARYELRDVEWVVKKRVGPGMFSVLWSKKAQDMKCRVTLAEWLMTTGELKYRGEMLYRCVRPVDRLLTVLHEAAHAVIYITMQNQWRDIQHGLQFQRVERQLCREFGYTPKYVRNPGYAESFLDNVSGEKVVLLDTDWTGRKPIKVNLESEQYD